MNQHHCSRPPAVRRLPEPARNCPACRAAQEPEPDDAQRHREHVQNNVTRVSAALLAVLSGPKFWEGLSEAPQIFAEYAKNPPSILPLICLAGMLWGMNQKRRQG